MVWQDKLKPVEEQGPPFMVRTESIDQLNVLQVLMVGKYLEQVLSSFEPMSPLLQCQFDSQQFLVPHIIVLFSRCKAMRH